jgi:hypothetical protein
MKRIKERERERESRRRIQFLKICVVVLDRCLVLNFKMKVFSCVKTIILKHPELFFQTKINDIGISIYGVGCSFQDMLTVGFSNTIQNSIRISLLRYNIKSLQKVMYTIK